MKTTKTKKKQTENNETAEGASFLNPAAIILEAQRITREVVSKRLTPDVANSAFRGIAEASRGHRLVQDYYKIAKGAGLMPRQSAFNGVIDVTPVLAAPIDKAKE